MNELTMVRLDAPRLPRGGLRCPVCGRLHGLGRRVFGLALVLAVFLALPAHRPAQADSGADRSAETGHERPEILVEAEPAVSTPAAVPSQAPVPPPPPAALAVPDTAVVWNREGLGVYLWDRPGGEIAGFIENGLVARVNDRWEAHGGVPFGEVEFERAMGWVDMRSVHRVVVPEGGFERLASGAYLYDVPGGRVLEWLTPGTPVIVRGVGSAREGGWIEVMLVVGGETGWIYPRGFLLPLREH